MSIASLVQTRQDAAVVKCSATHIINLRDFFPGIRKHNFVAIDLIVRTEQVLSGTITAENYLT